MRFASFDALSMETFPMTSSADMANAIWRLLTSTAVSVLLLGCSGTMKPLRVEDNRVTYLHYESRFEAAEKAARMHCAQRGLYARHEISRCDLLSAWIGSACYITGTCERCETLFSCVQEPPGAHRESAPTTRESFYGIGL